MHWKEETVRCNRLLIRNLLFKRHRQDSVRHMLAIERWRQSICLRANWRQQQGTCTVTRKSGPSSRQVLRACRIYGKYSASNIQEIFQECQDVNIQEPHSIS